MGKREEFFELRARFKALEQESDEIAEKLRAYRSEPGFWATRGTWAMPMPVEDLGDAELLAALRDAAVACGPDAGRDYHPQARAQLDALLDEAQRRRASAVQVSGSGGDARLELSCELPPITPPEEARSHVSIRVGFSRADCPHS